MTITPRFRQTAAEVLHATADVVTFDRSDVEELTAIASATPRRRARLCAHRDPTASLHDMLIVHPRGAYVRPHLHRGRAESMVVISGEALFVYFDQSGEPTAAYDLAGTATSRPFFIRTPADTFHTLIIKSEWLTFLEATEGPFESQRMLPAPWAPAETDTEATRQYLEHLTAQASALIRH